MSIQRQSAVCDGQVSANCHVSLKPNPRGNGAAFAIVAAWAYKEPLVFSCPQEGSLSIEKIAVWWASHNVWYSQSPGLLFLNVGGEELCVFTCFRGTQDGAMLGNAAAQGKKGWKVSEDVSCWDEVLGRSWGSRQRWKKAQTFKWPGRLFSCFYRNFSETSGRGDWLNATQFSIQRSERTTMHMAARWMQHDPMDCSLGAGGLRVPRHKIRKKTWGAQGKVVIPRPAWIVKKGSGDCSPFGDVCPVGNTVQFTETKGLLDKLEVFHCSWKKSLSTLAKMELSLFKGKRRARVGGLEPDCHWGVHEEGLPRTSPSLTQTSHQLCKWSLGRPSCREKPTCYQGTGLPWEVPPLCLITGWEH